MPKRNDYPHWSYSSRRAWQAAVRFRLRRLERALDDLQNGCAFFPDHGYDDIQRIGHATKDLRAKVCYKSWK